MPIARGQSLRFKGPSPWGIAGPQVSSCKNANIVVIKASPGASHPILDFYFLINIFILRMIVH
jgi:hypothetical protein